MAFLISENLHLLLVGRKLILKLWGPMKFNGSPLTLKCVQWVVSTLNCLTPSAQSVKHIYLTIHTNLFLFSGIFSKCKKKKERKSLFLSENHLARDPKCIIMRLYAVPKLIQCSTGNCLIWIVSTVTQ